MANAKVFISHSSKDRKIARTICTALENRGIKCWIASRDVGPGENFQEAIVRAIRATKVMVLVFTENANNSGEIKKELALASRYNLVVIPARAESVVPSEAFELEFATRQWVDLFEDWEQEIERLTSWIADIVGVEPAAREPAAPATPTRPATEELKAPPDESPKLPELIRAEESEPPIAPEPKPTEPERRDAPEPEVPAPPATALIEPATPARPEQSGPSSARLEPVGSIESGPVARARWAMRLLPAFIAFAILCVTTIVISSPFGEGATGPASAAPACDAATRTPVLYNCTPDRADTAWMLAAAALALLLAVPGLALVSAAMARKQDVGNAVAMSVAVAAFVAVLFAGIGYSPAFTSGAPLLGGFSRVFLQAMLGDLVRGVGNPNPLAATIPEAVFLLIQIIFAVMPPALIVGAFAERIKFSALLWFTALWVILVFVPVAHWIWGPDGILSGANPANAFLKMLDFAGGVVVFVNAGVTGGICSIVLGKRKEAGLPTRIVPPVLGTVLLWIGWFGVNAGSAGTMATPQAWWAMLVSQIAMGAAALAWMGVEWMRHGRPTLVGICTGAAVGLVAIAPGSGFVSPVGAMFIGLAAGVLCCLVSGLTSGNGSDRTFAWFAALILAGALGALLVGVLATEQYGGLAGLLQGNPRQLLDQAGGLAIVAAYNAALSFLLLKGLDLTVGLRLDPEATHDGRELAQHHDRTQ